MTKVSLLCRVVSNVQRVNDAKIDRRVTERDFFEKLPDLLSIITAKIGSFTRYLLHSILCTILLIVTRGRRRLLQAENT